MNKNGARCSPGFTLLEVLVALSIMGIALILIFQLFTSNLRALTVSGDVVAAAAKANARLREITTEPSLAAGSWSEAKEKDYPMEIAVSEVLQERTDNLPVRLMEIDLTVRWMAGRKEKRLTLRTMKMFAKAEPG